MIYLDNAATAYPKNEAALRRGLERYLTLGASPGRGGYDRAVEAEEAVSAVRRQVLEYFGAPPGSHVCFDYNATGALNSLIQGLGQGGGYIVSTRLEHNSVLRPLHHMAKAGLAFELVPFDEDGFVYVDAVEKVLQPETTAVVMTHASNVLGTLQPVEGIGALLQGRETLLCVDASQSAGIVPINMTAQHIDVLAFTGHKSLGGPTGIGGLIVGPDVALAPSRFGGTGVDSSLLFQPESYPSRLETGTQNTLGILSLGECLADLSPAVLTERLEGERQLLTRLHEELSGIPGVVLYGTSDTARKVPVLSCNVTSMNPSDVGAVLDGDFDIAVRTGLQCAPLVHADLGTAPSGTVRFSLGAHTRLLDINAAIDAMRVLASS